ncbi:MAG: hypothetical protein WBM09_11705 [Gallionella sp.]
MQQHIENNYLMSICNFTGAVSRSALLFRVHPTPPRRGALPLHPAGRKIPRLNPSWLAFIPRQHLIPLIN